MATGKGDGTSTWIKFFKEAGIPAGDAAQYAIIFTDNRIQKDMLMDLNKEYLNDMGVSRMGDVIAIIRHSKKVSTMEARSRVLQESVDSPISDKSSVEVRTVSKVTVAKQPPTAKAVAKASVAKAAKTVNKMAAAKATQRAASAAATSAAGPSTSPGSARDSPTGRRSTPASRLVGHYIGNDPEAHPMNSLTTKEKLSRDLACRLGPVTPGSRSPGNTSSPDLDIQSRLGIKKIRKVNTDALAMSTSDDLPDSSQIRFKVTGLSSSTPDSTQSSVFARLGAPALKRPAQSTSLDEVALPYAGIFKSVPEKKSKPNPETSITIKSRRPTEGILASESLSAKSGVMRRLGAQLGSAPLARKKMISTSASATKSPVSARLRMEAEVTSSADSTGSRSIFNRLGGKN